MLTSGIYHVPDVSLICQNTNIELLRKNVNAINFVSIFDIVKFWVEL